MSTRRDFLKSSGAVALGAAASSCQPSVSGESAQMLVTNPDHPTPATYDRLPLEWYQNNVRRLQQKLGERGLDGILVQDRWNIIYLTGLLHTTTERPFSCFIPRDELAVYWFYPGLDLELVRSWWYTDGDYYYDFHHTEGGNPREGNVVMGPPADLLEWTLRNLEKRGYGEKKIGLSQPPTVETLNRMKQVLPRADFQRVDDICMNMRMVKTPEEIALIQRAMDYFSKVHVFGRDYILEHGTDATDFDVGMACMQYGTDLIMQDISRDGHPHNAVGIQCHIGCRTGIGTAYPHPNQFHHNRIKRGDSIQISGVVTVGGYGGELYSPFQIEPWPDGGEEVWDVMAEGSRMQIEMSKAGTRCQEIAKAVHEMQVQNSMQPYLYQRVAHGQGMEGHQPPYIALGDDVVLEEGMTFSMEPGLFNPEGGYGYNPSECVLVTQDKGVPMGSVPNLTKDWALLKL
jgi:Xaa-Pro aminopeptidase